MLNTPPYRHHTRTKNRVSTRKHTTRTCVPSAWTVAGLAFVTVLAVRRRKVAADLVDRGQALRAARVASDFACCASNRTRKSAR
jgi:hypothetical protein